MSSHAVVGLLAHVDAGKTTLAEALLYRSGAIRKPGRVDHGDAYLDYYPVERERGITVYAKQMVVEHEGCRLMFLDAPGHADFVAEAERVMPVLDVAVLVVGANDGVRGHTQTLWRLLERYQVPTVVFVNKMDLTGADRTHVLTQMTGTWGDGFVDWAHREDEDMQEVLATADEAALDELLEQGKVSDETFCELVLRRAIFPCLFGSALHLEGSTTCLACCRVWQTGSSGLTRRASSRRVYTR